jgi:biotin transport system substrate-specific component
MIMQQTIALHLADRFSSQRTWLADFFLALAGSLLIALSAQISFRLPFSPVPVTGQTFAVLLVGFALGKRLAFISLSLYLIEGISGLPFFAGGGSSLAWLAGPTGGYLIGFIFSATLVGALAQRGFDRHILTTLAAFALGQAVIYLFGAVWLSLYTGWQAALQTGVLPFIAGDLAKALLAALSLPLTWKLLR